MPTLPYMKLHIADYLADTQHLTTQEHGAYLLLLMNYWQTEKPLNNKRGRLKSVVRLSTEEWKEVEITLSEFFTVEDDLWKHGRVEAELESVIALSTQASYAGSKSARVRAEKKRNSNGSSTTVEPKFNDRSDSVERKSNHKDIDKDKDIDIKSEFDLFWLAYPRKGDKKKALISFRGALTITNSAVIIAGARRYANDPNRDNAFTKLPTTWLNGECWNDSPLPVRKANGEKSFVATPVPQRMTREESEGNINALSPQQVAEQVALVKSSLRNKKGEGK